MKGIKYSILLFMLFALIACGKSGGESESSVGSASMGLQEGVTQSGFIEEDDDVDTYRVAANETNRFLHIHCAEQTSGSNVDLLVTVFEEINGERVRLFGKHKPDGATLSADLDLWIYIDTPKDLIIEVRDLMADDSSTQIAYLLTYTYQDSAEGNHDFSNAQSLAIGANGEMNDAIEAIGEVDCFTFDPQTNGVYSVDVDHHKPPGGSPVQLAISLYDRNGNKIQRIVDPYNTLLAYLEEASGPYFVIVEDADSMNGDTGAPYDISVVAVDIAEAQENDAAENATLVEADAQDIYTAAGAIDYGCASISPEHAGDVDWYRLAVGNVGGSTTYHFMELTINNGETVNGTAPIRVTVYDSEMETITSHDFSSGSGAYLNQFRAQNGEYYISVAPANSKRLNRGVNYQVQLREMALNDAAEETDDNTANSARALSDGTPVNGYVSYHSDVDWYGINVNTASASILSVDFTSAESIVDYQVSIWRGDHMVKKVTDMNGSDGPTHLRTSVMVPAENPGATATYHIKVCDAQNNEGSNVAYTLVAGIEPVLGAPGHILETNGSTLYYYDEAGQEVGETAEVELEIFSTLQPHFKANTTWLDFRNNPDITQTVQGDTTEIDFPWISGYIDYQGDRDFFQLDFDKLDPAGSETNWYYEVEIQLVIPSPGSDVEYVWKLYRDSNSNAIIMDDPTSPDGYKACAGDTTPQSQAPINLLTPTGSETFWIGSQWGEGAKFYIGMSDFNYLQLPDSGTANTEPDEDWGYDAPYYFKLKLTYHPGQAFPD